MEEISGSRSGQEKIYAFELFLYYLRRLSHQLQALQQLRLHSSPALKSEPSQPCAVQCSAKMTPFAFFYAFASASSTLPTLTSLAIITPPTSCSENIHS